MTRLRPLLLAAALCLALHAPAPGAQGDADAAVREADERAATVEERRGALASLLESARRLRESGEAAAAARALNRAGRLRLRLNSPQEALATYREALSLLRETSDPTADADSHNGLGDAYSSLSRCGEAEAHLRRALDLSEQAGYAAGRARALLTLSECQNFRDHSLALRTAQEALALWQSVGDRRAVAESHSAVGQYHLAQNNLAEAARNFEAALGLRRELGSLDGQAEALIYLGFIEYRRGAWQEVFALLTQAQALLDEKGEPYKMGQITAGLAQAHIESGSPELGLEKYRQALEYYRQTQNRRAVAVMIWGLGKTHYMMGDYAEALSHLRRALSEAEAIKEPTVAAMCNEYLGRTHAALGDWAAALGHFRVALGLYTRAVNPMEAARVRALVGRVYAQQGEAGKAREYYRSSLESFRALSDHVNESATLYALGSLELGRNNLDAAEDYLRRSIEVTENVRRVSTSRDLTAAFSATVHERYEAFVECLMRRHAADPSRGLDARAFEVSESSRARSLAELLRATGSSLVPGLDPHLAEQERALRQALRVKEDARVSLLGGKYRKEELEALDAELARLEADYERLDDTIRARHPAYEQIARPAAWDLRRIREQVVADEETVLLEYSLGAERSYVWAVTRDRVQSYELPARALIERAAEKVYALLSTRPAAAGEDELADASGELSRMVLSPVGALLDRERVVVVADGALNYVPFQFLPEPSAEGRPLVAAHEVVNAPSATVLGQLREEAARRRRPAKTLAAFGDPVFASNYALRKGAGADVEVAALRRMEAEGWRNSLVERGMEVGGDSFDPALIRPLFFAGLELANLREVTGGGEAFVAADFDATRERLQGTDLGEFAILHFATHGLLDPARPENSGLMLSTVDREGRDRAGFVGLRDIYSLRAPVGLVVLSACRTALGKEVKGEGLIGLARGFMYAGASGVVSSLWKVDDEATSELMKRFYANMLRRGMTPAAALRAAQNSIRQEPQWRSPHYWAAFTLQGEYRQVVAPAAAASRTAYTKALVGVLLLALAACGAWWYRRRRAA